MTNKNNIIFKVLCSFFILFFLIILISTIRSHYTENLRSDQLVTFKGKLTSLKEKKIGGGRKHSVIFYKLDNHPATFKISNTSYKALNKSDFGRNIHKGSYIEIGTTSTELKKADTDNLIQKIKNLIFKTYNNPETYFFKKDDIQYLHLENYNLLKRHLIKSNLIWGIPFCLIGIALFTFMMFNWTTDFHDA